MMATGYYDTNAKSYFHATVNVDMSSLHAKFLQRLGDGATILDAGCGSGRDAKAFKDLGHRVEAFDASAKLAGLAAAYLQQDVPTKSFLDVDEVAVYDGIWACASLLHVAETDQPRAWAGLWRALKPGGVVYASYKLADGPQANERLDELGRPFTDATEARVARWLQGLRDVAGVDTWVTGDLRPGQAQAWLNVLAHRR
jgi:SAM-dependent methyltransferase